MNVSNYKWIVDLREYERGWGSKVFDHQEFQTYDDAKKFQQEVNSKNDLYLAPDCFIIAEEPRPKEK